MKSCIVCKKRLPAKPLFVLEHAPASAQDIPDAQQVKEDAGVTLGLYQCEACGLVQFDCTPVSYYRDVIRAGGFSTTMTGLRRSQYRHLIETYRLEGKKFLEVGCGRGEFLKVLTEFPVQAYGMEHKDDLVKTAQAEGLQVWQEFPEKEDQVFGREAGVAGPFNVFLSFNFLEHQPHPDVMLRAIRNNLSDGGMGLVTVPALEYIVEQGSYYELIRDHIAYYSFEALRALLGQCGFAVLEEEMLNRDTISMIVKKMPEMPEILEMPERPGMPETLEIPGKTSEPPESLKQSDGNMIGMREPAGTGDTSGTPEERSMVEALVRGYDRVQREISGLLERLRGQEKTLALWGASHQGFTLAATTGLGRQARYIIDSAPFKQGRFAPSSHLPIVAPDHFHEEPVDAVLIVAPGYTDEIAESIRRKFGDAVEILTMRTDHVELLDAGAFQAD